MVFDQELHRFKTSVKLVYLTKHVFLFEACVKHIYLVKHVFIWNKYKTWISGKTGIPHIANPVHRRTLQIALLQGSHNRGEQIGNHT